MSYVSITHKTYNQSSNSQSEDGRAKIDWLVPVVTLVGKWYSQINHTTHGISYSVTSCWQQTYH